MNHSVSQPVESRAAKAVREILESGRPLTYIRSAEEQRVVRILAEVAKGPLSSTPLPVWTWSLTDGMRRPGEIASSTDSPRAALDFILAHEGASIFHLKDFHEPLRESPKSAAGCATSTRLPRSTEVRGHYFAGAASFLKSWSAASCFLELRPPDLVELVEFLREEDARHQPTKFCHPVARALQGLTLDEARYALRRALCRGPAGSVRKSLPVLLEEKRLLVNRSGVIEYIADGTDLGDVGGLEGLKTWLVERSKLVRNARQPRRRDRAQGDTPDGHSRLRQKPLR